MINNSKNKMVKSDEVKNKSEEYFFSGGQEYLPQTIRADSREEAERVWEETRKKVDEPLEENN